MLPEKMVIWMVFNHADDDEPVMFFNEEPTGQVFKDMYIIRKYLLTALDDKDSVS